MSTTIPQLNVRDLTLYSDEQDEWQRRHILENLPKLIIYTTCNVLFLSVIRKAGALSEYDEQELVHKYPVPVEKSKQFYEILVRRKNCYHILRNALEETRQTGALEILDKALLTDVLNELKVPSFQIGEFKNNIDSKFGPYRRTLTHKAIETQGVQQLQKLKLLKADFETKDANGHTPLLLLANKNFADKFAWFVSEQIDLHAVDNNGNNLVFLAALNGKSKYELQLLVESGGKWDIENKNYRNIMHLAAEGGNTQALEYFKSLGADVNARDKFGYTPLLQLAAAKTNFAKTFAWFVNEQIYLDAVENEGYNLVFLAALTGKSKDELQILVNAGVKWDINNKNCQNIMHLAAAGGNLEALKYFKSLGADINARDTFGDTPLLRLVYAKRSFAETLAWFVNEQIDLHAVDNNGNNLVFLAALNGKSKDELQLLVNSGIKWNIKNKKGQILCSWQQKVETL